MAEQGRKGIMLLLAVIAVTALMDGLDGSIVNVALPTLAGDFGTDTGTVAWITVTYLLMLAGLLMLFARIAKNGAVKKVISVGIGLFTISSLFCGISTNFEMLIIFRAAQGIGAAMMGAAVPMLCVKYLPSNMMGLGMGILTLGCSIGFAIGPAIGGIIVDVLSWHWIFLINLPVGIIVLALTLKVVPKDEPYKKGGLDVSGAILLFAAAAAGVLALERAPYPESLTMVTVAAVVSIICLAAFVLVELRKSDPLLDVRVFKHWKFDFVFLAFMLGNLAYMGLLYLMPFYMDVVMGWGSSASGTYLFIPPLITLILCIPISRWSDRTGRRWFCVTACVALVAGSSIMSLFAREAAVIPLLATLICMGLMWAFCGGPMASRIVENTAGESREIGSSLMNESIYLGGTIGTALFAMIFTAGTGAGGVNFTDLQPDVFLDGFIISMVAVVVISAITAVLSYTVKDPKVIS
ncbi:MAG: DHA2 family efflux MFS transporter permease subunit [Candidatus Methanoplasma sp.]|nr:DHA2 family efflux MFS transporter permease subunit [Candidatus Methanoplasma sp.]